MQQNNAKPTKKKLSAAIFFALSSRNLLNWVPDQAYLSAMWLAYFHKKFDWKNPKSFNEKIQWLKVKDRNPLYPTLVDKFAVRAWIADKIGEEYLIPLVGGPWKNFDEIDFNALPEQFVLKCTHDSGNVVICHDKRTFDFVAAKEKIEKSLKRNYYWSGREWQYKNVKPQIIAEKYMEDTNFDNKEPNEYQFWCFNGIPRFISVIFQPHGDNSKATYDIDWNRLDFVTSNPEYSNEVKKPDHYETMKDLACKLCEDQIFIRVDFMVFNSQFYFGELTKSPASGFLKWQPEEKDLELGALLDITKRGR